LTASFRATLPETSRKHVLKIPASQLAKARARKRGGPAPANDNADSPAQVAAAFGDQAQTDLATQTSAKRPQVVVDNTADEDEPPFDPPDLREALAFDVEEETEFVSIAPPEVTIEVSEPAPEPESGSELEAGSAALQTGVEEDLPFDAPDEEDEIFQPYTVEAAPEPPAAPKPLFSSAARAEPATDEPLPPVSVHVFWDRADSARTVRDFAADRRAANASFDVSRGGIDAAAARYSRDSSPDLLIVDTDLNSADILAALDRLTPALSAATQVIVLGGVNDVTLLRELAARGVAEYLVSPFKLDHLARAACGLFATTDTSHTIAVIGARGGVGASTLAMNLAWSIAERHDAGAALVDLDLAFGRMLAPPSPHSFADAFADPDAVDAALERCVRSLTPRLKHYPGPSSLAQLHEFEADTLRAIVGRVRRGSSFVVLDLPHSWSDWIKHTLICADSVVIVTTPDLAGLRNTDNMLKLLRSESARVSVPTVVLSMTGVPKKPEIAGKDFVDALMVSPSAAFEFDPALFGEATLKSQALGEFAPNSKAARAIDELATLLTGREIVTPSLPKPIVIDEPQVSQPEKTPAELVLTDKVAPPALPAAPLELVQQMESSANGEAAPARRPRTAKPKRRRRKSSGLLRAAAITVLAFVLAADWYQKHQTRAANAAEAATLPSSALAPQLTRAELFAEQYRDALLVIGAGDADEGAAILRRLGDRGYAPAQFRLAKMYERGEFLPVDANAARAWTERAAAGGHPRAMHDLGVYSARGDAAPANEADAFRWFRRAADYDIGDSQYNLGVLYQEGRGVTQDAREALFWFLLAARHDDAAASERAAQIEAHLTPGDVRQTHARAEAFRPRADPFPQLPST